jgi:hypothetical protein
MLGQFSRLIQSEYPTKMCNDLKLCLMRCSRDLLKLIPSNNPEKPDDTRHRVERFERSVQEERGLRRRVTKLHQLLLDNVPCSCHMSHEGKLGASCQKAKLCLGPCWNPGLTDFNLILQGPKMSQESIICVDNKE